MGQEVDVPRYSAFDTMGGVVKIIDNTRDQVIAIPMTAMFKLHPENTVTGIKFCHF